MSKKLEKYDGGLNGDGKVGREKSQRQSLRRVYIERNKRMMKVFKVLIIGKSGM